MALHFPSLLPSFQYFNTYFLLLLSSPPDGAPDFVTPVSASQPVPLTPGIIPHHRARLASLRAGDGAHRDIKRGKLEDAAERGEGGRHRERSLHASLDQATFCFGAEWNHG